VHDKGQVRARLIIVNSYTTGAHGEDAARRHQAGVRQDLPSPALKMAAFMKKKSNVLMNAFAIVRHKKNALEINPTWNLRKRRLPNR
jgi:hypothetical protein